MIPFGGVPPGDDAYALAFGIPTNTPGLKFICRETVAPPFPDERAAGPLPGGPVDYDENAVPEVRAQLTEPDPRWTRELGQIVAPTLLITGGPESPVPQDRLPEMEALIPDCRLITLGGGYDVHRVNAEQVAQRITEFFTS